jgi:hypothetical protein
MKLPSGKKLGEAFNFKSYFADQQATINQFHAKIG